MTMEDYFQELSETEFFDMNLDDKLSNWLNNQLFKLTRIYQIIVINKHVNCTIN
jgi:hypothetical protein